MEGIGQILKEKIATKPKNIGERHLILGDIGKRLAETSYKRVSKARLGQLLSVYKTCDELRLLHRNCIDAKNYAAMFWYYVCPKKGVK